MFLDSVTESRSRAVFVGVTVTFILASLFVAARLVSRFGILKHRGWDDYCIVLAWILAFGMSFTVDFATSKGLGRHDRDIPAAWGPPLLAAEYAAFVLYSPAVMVTKASILLFYLSLALNTLKFLRIASYVNLAVVNVAGVVLTFITVFQCHPVQAAYSLAVENPSCISIENIYLASAPINVATDLAILVLPIPVVTGMRLPRRQKTILLMTFMLGVFVTVVDVVRIYYLQLAASSIDMLASVKITTSLEFSYNGSLALLWSAVEVNVGIICACIPTLRPLIKRLVPGMASDRARNRAASFSSQGSFPDSSKYDELLQPSSATGPAADAEDLQPECEVQLAENQEYQMRMIDVITTPNEDPRTVLELARTPSQHTEYNVYFGLVNVERPKCMLYTRGSESVKYCTVVTILFFLMGFSYGLLSALNYSAIASVVIQSKTQATQVVGMTSAYFGGYIFGPLLLGQWVLRHFGFKVTFVTSLGIYCIGTLMFWPSGGLRSYPGFVVSNFVIGFGLSLLELASNSFLVLCGPPRYAEFRLLMARGVGTVATVLSRLLADSVFSVNFVSTQSLIVVQWTYLAIALFTVLLALFFYYMPLPEATDSDLQSQAEKLGIYPSQKYFGRLPVRFTTLAMAILSMIALGGAWECTDIFFSDLLSSVSEVTGTSQNLTTGSFYVGATAVFATSQIVSAFLCLLVPPRVLLLLDIAGCMTLSALMMVLEVPSVNDTMTLGFFVVIFEGPIFSLIFAIGLRGLGRWSKLAASLLISTWGLGACVFPVVMLAVLQDPSHSIQYSFCVTVALFAAGTLSPLYLNLFRAARDQDAGAAQRLPRRTCRWRHTEEVVLERSLGRFRQNTGE